MSLRKGDLVVCLDSGQIGTVISQLPHGRLKIYFTGDVVILDYEDVLFLGDKSNVGMSTPERN